ncbi:hypothetical protein CTI14_45600, partial [Methylobacterium radiotolerans]
MIDETGDRKYGTHTAHVGRQYLGSLGKVDSGIVTVHERHKTATGLVNTEPGKAGSRHKAAQRLQWFLSESTWDPDALHQARLDLMRNGKCTAPSEEAV